MGPSQALNAHLLALRHVSQAVCENNWVRMINLVNLGTQISKWCGDFYCIG